MRHSSRRRLHGRAVVRGRRGHQALLVTRHLCRWHNPAGAPVGPKKSGGAASGAAAAGVGGADVAVSIEDPSAPAPNEIVVCGGSCV